MRYEYKGFKPSPGMSNEQAIDAQAVLLLRERMEMFGDEWKTNCAIRIPLRVQAEIFRMGWRAWMENSDARGLVG